MYFSTLSCLALVASSALSQSTQQLFNFSSYVDIENSALRPNGHLLLSTFDQAHLYTLNPLSPSPKAELVAALPGATAATGITTIGFDKFAVIGGVRGSYHYDNETIYTIDFSSNATNPTIKVVAKVPNANMLNGMAALPTKPHVVLAADSRIGGVFRIDTDTGTAELVFTDEAMAAPVNASTPIGINGLKVFGGYIYFTNTIQGLFARVPINEDGDKVGDVEVIATLDVAATGYDWDDFVLDANGVAYLAQPNTALAKISPDGVQGIIAGGGNSSILIGPTSVTLARDGKTAYVTTRGGTVDGVLYSGQVVKVQLPAEI